MKLKEILSYIWARWTIWVLLLVVCFLGCADSGSSSSPSFTAIEPSKVFTAGEVRLKISGSGFNEGMSVKVGNETCQNVTLHSSSLISCSSPAKTPGTFDVQVIWSSGPQVTFVNGLAYASDAFTSKSLEAGQASSSGFFDASGTEARHRKPYGITNDGTYFYIIEQENNVVRKIHIGTGEVSFVAGGRRGFRNGVGAEVKFDRPRNLTHSNGVLYILDTYNDCIRKLVISTQTVSTLAGECGFSGNNDGIGSAAHFHEPSAALMAPDGVTLYVSDSNNKSLRTINIDTQVVTTVVGSAGNAGTNDGVGTSARFARPWSMVIIGGDMYILDSSNDSVRKIRLSDYTMTTFAGLSGTSGSVDGIGAAARFNDPRGLTTDGTHLYLTESNGFTVRKIRISDQTVTTLAGTTEVWGKKNGLGTAALFNSPKELDYYQGSLYIAGYFDNNIRKLDLSTNQVSTFTGGPGELGTADGSSTDARFDSPWGSTADGSDLYFVSYNQSTVRKYNIDTKVTTTIAGIAGTASSLDGPTSSATFKWPGSLTKSGTNLYVSDYENHAIRKIDLITNSVTTFVGKMSYSGSTDATGTSARFLYPFDILAVGDHLYISDTDNHTIRKVIIATGVVTTFAGQAGSPGSTDGVGTAARFNQPWGLTSDGTYLYVADKSNHIVRKIDLSTGTVTTLAGWPAESGFIDGAGGNARFNLPGELALNGEYIYLTEQDNHSLRKINTNSGLVTTLGGTPDRKINLPGVEYLNMGSFFSPSGIEYTNKGLIVTTPEGIYRVY